MPKKIPVCDLCAFYLFLWSAIIGFGFVSVFVGPHHNAISYFVTQQPSTLLVYFEDFKRWHMKARRSNSCCFILPHIRTNTHRFSNNWVLLQGRILSVINNFFNVIQTLSATDIIELSLHCVYVRHWHKWVVLRVCHWAFTIGRHHRSTHWRRHFTALHSACHAVHHWERVTSCVCIWRLEYPVWTPVSWR